MKDTLVTEETKIHRLYVGVAANAPVRSSPLPTATTKAQLPLMRSAYRVIAVIGRRQSLRGAATP